MEKLIQVEACSSVLWRQQLKLAVLCRLLQLFAGNLAASLCFHHFLMLSCWKLSFMIREVTFLHCPVPFSSSQGGIPKQTKAVTFLCVCVCVCWPQHGAVLLLRKVGHTFCRLAKWIFDIKVAFVQIQGPLGGKTAGGAGRGVPQHYQSMCWGVNREEVEEFEESFVLEPRCHTQNIPPFLLAATWATEADRSLERGVVLVHQSSFPAVNSFRTPCANTDKGSELSKNLDFCFAILWVEWMPWGLRLWDTHSLMIEGHYPSVGIKQWCVGQRHGEASFSVPPLPHP